METLEGQALPCMNFLVKLLSQHQDFSKLINPVKVAMEHHQSLFRMAFGASSSLTRNSHNFGVGHNTLSQNIVYLVWLSKTFDH